MSSLKIEEILECRGLLNSRDHCIYTGSGSFKLFVYSYIYLRLLRSNPKLWGIYTGDLGIGALL